ncbi:MAG: hypothetical protein ACOY3X_13385 [Pseudomonadota bacterium]
MSLRPVLALALLALSLPAAAANAWLDALHDQQLALYRLTGNFYMTTHEDAEREYLDSLPAQVSAYNKARDATNTAASGDRARAQQAAAIQEASAPIEALVGKDIQRVIASEQKKYINNGVFNAFQRATDVHNQMAKLEAAFDVAVRAAGSGDRNALFMEGAIDAETLASHYARLATGYFDESRETGKASLAAASSKFTAVLDKARAEINRDDPMQRVAFDRIEARWKFVQSTLAKPAENRPRLVYRYLREISDNFVKLASLR